MNYQHTPKYSYIFTYSCRICCPLHTKIQYDSQILVQTLTYQIKIKCLPEHNYYLDRDKHSCTVSPALLQNVFKKQWCSDDKHYILQESQLFFVILIIKCWYQTCFTHPYMNTIMLWFIAKNKTIKPSQWRQIRQPTVSQSCSWLQHECVFYHSWRQILQKLSQYYIHTHVLYLIFTSSNSNSVINHATFIHSRRQKF